MANQCGRPAFSNSLPVSCPIWPLPTFNLMTRRPNVVGQLQRSQFLNLGQ